MIKHHLQNSVLVIIWNNYVYSAMIQSNIYSIYKKKFKSLKIGHCNFFYYGC